jgi:hypothetical protein
LLSVGCALLGCPQLLEDGFENESSLPDTALDSGGARYNDPDASVELAGSGGAPGSGGAANTAASGSGGAAGSGLAGGANGGTAGEPGTLPDGGPHFQPATELGQLLAHRYRFNDAGFAIIDEAGTANGVAVGVAVSAGTGKITLSGNEQYLNLPNGLISGQQSVTIEAWVNWLADSSSATAEWQNVFDFGSSGSEDVPGFASNRLYLAAKGHNPGHARAGFYTTNFDHEIYVDASQALPASADLNQGTQVVLVVDGEQGSLTLYIDGDKSGATSNGQPIALALIQDINDWVGRSQYSADPEFDGEILDFRIYSTALSETQVELSFSLGADADL